MRGVGLALLGSFKYLDDRDDVDDDHSKKANTANDNNNNNDNDNKKKNNDERMLKETLRMRRQAIRANLVGYIAVVSEARHSGFIGDSTHEGGKLSGRSTLH